MLNGNLPEKETCSGPWDCVISRFCVVLDSIPAPQLQKLEIVYWLLSSN